MDRGVLPVDLFGTNLSQIHDLACAVQCMDGSSTDAILEEIRPETRTVRTREVESPTLIRYRMENLRSITLQGIIPDNEKAEILDRVLQGKVIASDSICITYRDGQKLSFGPHHRTLDDDGLHLYQFYNGGRLARVFVPAEVIATQESASADTLARAELLQAANHIVTTPQQLQTCLRLGAAMVAIAASKRPAPTRQRLAELLVREHVVSEQQIHEALELRQNNPKKRTGDILLEMGALSEEELNLCIAKLFGVPYVRLHDFPIPEGVAAMLKIGVVRRAKTIPIMTYGDYLVVATNNPANVETLDILRFATDRSILPVLATQLEIDRKIDELYMKVDHSDMLEQFALIGTYDEIVKKIKARSAGVIDRVTFAITTRTPDDEERLKQMIKELKAA